MSRRSIAVVSMSLAAASPPPPAPKLELVGHVEIAAGTRFRGVPIGGLSGIDRAPDGSYLVISDDRGGAGRPPRLYRFAIRAGGPDGITVMPGDQIVLRGRDGAPLPADRSTVDPEAVRVRRDGRIYWSSEGVWSDDPAARVQPAIVEANARGRTIRHFVLPSNFLYHDNATRGARSNAVFEGLALDGDGRVSAITEAPLFDDLPADAPADAPAPLRLTRFSPRTGRAEAQYAVVVPDRRYAVSDLLADGPRGFLAVERALPFDAGYGAAVRIVRLGIPRNATDVLHRASLSGGGFVPLTREIVLDLADLAPGMRIDNIEGIARGPMLRDGRRTLVLISDDNFNPKQVTQVILVAWRSR